MNNHLFLQETAYIRKNSLIKHQFEIQKDKMKKNRKKSFRSFSYIFNNKGNKVQTLTGLTNVQILQISISLFYLSI